MAPTAVSANEKTPEADDMSRTEEKVGWNERQFAPALKVRVSIGFTANLTSKSLTNESGITCPCLKEYPQVTRVSDFESM